MSLVFVLSQCRDHSLKSSGVDREGAGQEFYFGHGESMESSCRWWCVCFAVLCSGQQVWLRVFLQLFLLVTQT